MNSLSANSAPFHFLLPLPKEVRLIPGRFPLTGPIEILTEVTDPRITRAAERWAALLGFPNHADSSATLRLTHSEPSPSGGGSMGREGFCLEIKPRNILIAGGSPVSCFYALQTLAQLTRLCANEKSIPCCSISDGPDFSARGLLHDISRGKVPTLQTLKGIVDRLAELKMNQFQLYIEHAFVFPFDPKICDTDHGITPDEVKDLEAYCHDRFVRLVPALATFGHMGRILCLPRYRHLAEIEPPAPWEELSWPQRARGFTLDCANPESFELVERMWSDILNAFSSDVVNLCGDEPWDLGKGKNKGRFEGDGQGRAYLTHIRRTHDFCASRGRKTQFWSDVVRNYPKLFDQVPHASTVLHWGYDDRTDYEVTAQFVDSGLETFVCPGTSGWKRILNAMNLAERNITTFTRNGRKAGATGLLNTDWGDHGHFNALACSWHGIALGASLAWNTKQPTGEEFDEAFSRTILGFQTRRAVAALREAAHSADHCETWRLFWQPLKSIVDDPTLPSLEEAERLAASADDARKELVGETSTPNVTDSAELILACRFLRLFAGKVRFARQVQSLETEAAPWLEELKNAMKDYAAVWRKRNKESALADIQNVADRLELEFNQSYSM